MLSCWCQQILSDTHEHLHRDSERGSVPGHVESHNYCHPSRDRGTKFCWNNTLMFNLGSLLCPPSAERTQSQESGSRSSLHKGHWGHQSDDWRQAIQMMPSESVDGAINTVLHITNYFSAPSLWTVSFLGRKTLFQWVSQAVPHLS